MLALALSSLVLAEEGDGLSIYLPVVLRQTDNSDEVSNPDTIFGVGGWQVTEFYGHIDTNCARPAGWQGDCGGLFFFTAPASTMPQRAIRKVGSTGMRSGLFLQRAYLIDC